MYHLIKKELILQKKMLYFGALYSIFLFIVFSNPVLKEFVYIMSAFGISYIAIIGIAQAEYKNNSDIIMNSLPLTRRQIIISKYLSILVFTLIALAIVTTVGTILNLLPLPFDYRFLNIKDILITVISVLVLASVSLPAYIKSGGGQWSMAINIVIFMLIFFAPAQITSFLVINQQQAWVQSVTYFVQEHIWLVSTASIAVMLIFLFISFSVSLRIYLNRDF